MGQLVQLREQAKLMYDYWIVTLISNAIFEMDIDSIDKIIQRLDGAAPDEHDRYLYANYFGDALEVVMNMDKLEKCNLMEEDAVVMGLAKCVVAISLQSTLKVNGTPDLSKIKAKSKAIDIIFERIAGRRNQPVSRSEVISFDEPDWMKGLGYEETVDRDGDGNTSETSND